MVTLNKPAAGDVGWAGAINDNWTALESAVNSAVSYDIFNLTAASTTLTTSERGKVVTNYGYAAGFAYAVLPSTPAAGICYFFLRALTPAAYGIVIDTGSATVLMRGKDGVVTGRYKVLNRDAAWVHLVSYYDGSTRYWQIIEERGCRGYAGNTEWNSSREVPEWLSDQRWNGRLTPGGSASPLYADGILQGLTLATFNTIIASALDYDNGPYVDIYPASTSDGTAQIYPTAGNLYPWVPECGLGFWCKFGYAPTGTISEANGYLSIGIGSTPLGLSSATALMLTVSVNASNQVTIIAYAGANSVTLCTNVAYAASTHNAMYAYLTYATGVGLRVYIFDRYMQLLYSGASATSTTLSSNNTTPWAFGINCAARYNNGDKQHWRIYYVSAGQNGDAY